MIFTASLVVGSPWHAAINFALDVIRIISELPRHAVLRAANTFPRFPIRIVQEQFQELDPRLHMYFANVSLHAAAVLL